MAAQNGIRCVLHCDMLPPLKSQILKWGLLLNGSTEPSIYKLSSRAPRFIFTQLWDIFIVWIQTLPIYPANNIRRASSRILIAAFRSRSIRFPHVQRYTLSESFSSFFILPHLQHFLLEGKNGLHVPTSFLSMSAYIPAIPETFRNRYP